MDTPILRQPLAPVTFIKIHQSRPFASRIVQKIPDETPRVRMMIKCLMQSDSPAFTAAVNTPPSTYAGSVTRAHGGERDGVVFLNRILMVNQGGKRVSRLVPHNPVE